MKTPTIDPERPPSPIGPIARAINTPFIAIIRLYRVTLSPIVGRQCRYHPTCSAYGLEAFRLHGPIRGLALTCRRILRCHPFVKGGYDPVPIPDTEPGAKLVNEQPASSEAPNHTPSTPNTGRSSQ